MIFKKKQVLSIYIHIPFCERKCAYCDFLSFPGKDHQIEAYVNQLNQQIASLTNKNEWLVKSIYLGGGTPSLLSPSHIYKILETLRTNYDLDENCEITIECNPGTLNLDKIKAYKSAGINRISMGVQSTQTDQLVLMNRIHDRQTVFDQYQLLRDEGFCNISLDLIYGLPNQTAEQWKRQLAEIIDLGPEHLSVYGLTVEEGTPFYQLYAKSPEMFPSEALDREMYWLAHDLLTESGYEHYEISNYGKKNYHSYHNDVYWKMLPYVGFGIGAASYMDDARFSTIDSLTDYINGHEQLKSFVDADSIETMDQQREIEEYLFLGLRRLVGISLVDFKKRFHKSIDDYYKLQLTTLIEEGLIELTGNNLRLTRRGIDLSNYVLSHFLFEEDGQVQGHEH